MWFISLYACIHVCMFTQAHTPTHTYPHTNSKKKYTHTNTCTHKTHTTPKITQTHTLNPKKLTETRNKSAGAGSPRLSHSRNHITALATRPLLLVKRHAKRRTRTRNHPAVIRPRQHRRNNWCELFARFHKNGRARAQT